MALFAPAQRAKRRARIALIGPTGSGKTYTALKIARGLCGPKGVIAVVDTERSSATLYSDITPFGHMDLTQFSPQDYTRVLKEAAGEGIDVLIIDSLSHAWAGPGGALELVDRAAERNRGNSFGSWRDVTPLHNEMVQALLACPFHLIVTMRSKMAYVQEKDEQTGKTSIRKVGLQPVQREGMEYEFDVVADLEGTKMIVTKTRYSPFNGKVFFKPDVDVGEELGRWLSEGIAPPAPAPAPVVQVEEATAPAPATQPVNVSYSGERAKLWNMITLYNLSIEAFLKGIRKAKVVKPSFKQEPGSPLIEQLSDEAIHEIVVCFDDMFPSETKPKES